MSRSRSASWMRLVPIGLSPLAVAGLGLTLAGGYASGANASMRGDARLAVPRLISLAYGRYRPQGAPHPYLALRLTALEPHGQIVGAQFRTSDGHAAVGDGACGIGGRRAGHVETFYMPFQLSSGIHDVTVTAVGSACTSSTKTRAATRTFRIRVR